MRGSNTVAAAIVIDQGIFARIKKIPMIPCSSREKPSRQTRVYSVYTTLPFKSQHAARDVLSSNVRGIERYTTTDKPWPIYQTPTGKFTSSSLPKSFPHPKYRHHSHWDQPDHDDPLTESDTVEAFFKCKARADTHLRFIRDGPIGGLVPNYLLSAYGSVVVDFADQVPGVIRYSEVVEILRTISWKMSRESYRACVVRVLRTGPLGELLGKVSVSKTI